MQALQGQAVGDGEAKNVVVVDRRRQHRVAGQAGHLLQLANFQLQLLREEPLQARKPKGVAQTHHVFDLGIAVGVREVTQRALHFADEVVENRLERGKDFLQFRGTGLGGVALEMLGLGEGELHVLGQGTGEVVAAQRNRPLPDDLSAVGDDEVARSAPMSRATTDDFLPSSTPLTSFPSRS